MQYFSNFETKIFKLFSTVLIAIGQHATISHLHYMVTVGCKSDNDVSPT